MAAATAVRWLAPYAGRLLEDEHLQDEIRQIARDLRSGSRRARAQGPRRAAGDRQVRRRVAAAGRTGFAVARELRDAAPPPRRRRSRTALTVASMAAATAAVVNRRTRGG